MEQPILYNLNSQTAYKLKINMIAKKWTLNKEELLKVGKNALIFLAPALIIFLTQLQQGISLKESLVPVYLWGLNILVDFLRKFSEGK
jgi:hypothetical protein